MIIRSRLKELVAIKERSVGGKITQKDISEQTGLTEHTVGRWMKPDPFDRIEVSSATILCRYLNCDLGDLIYIDVEQEPQGA